MANIMKRKNGNGGMATGSLTPFGGLVDDILQNTLSRFFNDDLDDLRGSQAPPVNIQETDESYELEVMAPGLKKEDFSVNIGDNTLTVSFEHSEENKEENKRNGYLRQEYKMQSFRRSFALDDSIDAGKVTAQYKDGVLHLHLPKKEETQRITKSVKVM